MANTDLTFLHAPSVYDFRKRATLWGPISDVVPSTPIYDMYPLGFAVLSDYLERHGPASRSTLEPKQRHRPRGPRQLPEYADR